jgi:hypothetical protein
MKKLIIPLIIVLISLCPILAICGDSYCNLTEETQENCCTDCGCPFYHRCEVNSCSETSADVGAGMGVEIGRGFSFLAIPLGGILLIGGIILILVANIIGGFKEESKE